MGTTSLAKSHERFSRGSTFNRATTSWPSIAALTTTLPAASGRRYPPASIAADPGGSTLQPANPVRSLTVPSADCRRSSSCTPGSSAVIVAASGLIVSTGAREGTVGASAWMGFGLATPSIEWRFMVRLRWCKAMDTQARFVGYSWEKLDHGQG